MRRSLDKEKNKAFIDVEEYAIVSRPGPSTIHSRFPQYENAHDLAICPIVYVCFWPLVPRQFVPCMYRKKRSLLRKVKRQMSEKS